MERPEGPNILPGMTATVVAQRAGIQSVDTLPFVIPISAVFAEVMPDPMVWVVDDARRVQRRKVRLGSLTGSASIEIDDGLKSGETLVIQAVGRLREGMVIDPQPKGKQDES